MLASDKLDLNLLCQILRQGLTISRADFMGTRGPDKKAQTSWLSICPILIWGRLGWIRY